MPISPSKSRDLADENNKILTEWKWFETTVLEPNLVWIITMVSSFKIVSGDAVHQSTWLLLLKIEHTLWCMVKLQVLDNNSKTVNNIRNLTRVKMISTARSNLLPCNFEENLITHLGVIALFSSNFQNFNTPINQSINSSNLK